jgi:hypothetical protein
MRLQKDCQNIVREGSGDSPLSDPKNKSFPNARNVRLTVGESVAWRDGVGRVFGKAKAGRCKPPPTR